MENRKLAEERLALMRTVLSYMKKIVAKQVPQSGQLKQSVGVRCDVTGRGDHEYFYKVEKDLTDPEGHLLRLLVGVHREGYDRVVSHYRFKGTKQEILDEIDRMMENPEECVEEVLELSDRLAEFYE